MMNSRLTQDHRQTKEGQGSNPKRLPVPKLSINKIYMYSEPVVVKQAGDVKAVIPNMGKWYNFFRDTRTNGTGVFTGDIGSSINFSTNELTIDSGESVEWLVHEFPSVTVDRVTLVINEEPGRNNIVSGDDRFLDVVEFSVSTDGTTYHPINVREQLMLPAPSDTLYFKVHNPHETASATYSLRSSSSDPRENGYEEPWRLDL